MALCSRRGSMRWICSRHILWEFKIPTSRIFRPHFRGFLLFYSANEFMKSGINPFRRERALLWHSGFDFLLSPITFRNIKRFENHLISNKFIFKKMHNCGNMQFSCTQTSFMHRLFTSKISFAYQVN